MKRLKTFKTFEQDNSPHAEEYKSVNQDEMGKRNDLEEEENEVVTKSRTRRKDIHTAEKDPYNEPKGSKKVSPDMSEEELGLH